MRGEAAMSRVEESRRRVRERLAEIGRAADREVERALAVKDAAIALLGALGLLVAARRVGKKLGNKKKKTKRGTPSAPSSASRS